MKPINLIQPGSPALRKTQACEACGEPFTCEISSGQGCWCGEVKLSEDTLLELRAKYGSCVCRICLEKLATKEHAAAESER
jgi:hypothetical protein